MPSENKILDFQPITKQVMPTLMRYLDMEKSRTCDFSYGGILMWVDLYKYEYAISADTLFIKGVSPLGDGSTAFSIPVGDMPLSDAVRTLREYCLDAKIPLVFSCVPEEKKDELLALQPREVTELDALGDYLYSAEALSTLAGKKLSKKRNHVNQFMAYYPDWRYERLQESHIEEIRRITTQTIQQEAAQTDAAKMERYLSDKFIQAIHEGDENILGGVLKVNEEIIAYTIGDIKDDTLYIHIEKAERRFNGSFEMINKCFAADMVASFPQLEYINREDDAGDQGLRFAKHSYYPTTILKKYNVIF